MSTSKKAAKAEHNEAEAGPKGTTKTPPPESIVAVGIRMPSHVHEDLRELAWRERVSLNSLLVEGAQKVVNDRKKRGIL